MGSTSSSCLDQMEKWQAPLNMSQHQHGHKKVPSNSLLNRSHLFTINAPLISQPAFLICNLHLKGNTPLSSKLPGCISIMSVWSFQISVVKFGQFQNLNVTKDCLWMSQSIFVLKRCHHNYNFRWHFIWPLFFSRTVLIRNRHITPWVIRNRFIMPFTLSQ